MITLGQLQWALFWVAVFSPESALWMPWVFSLFFTQHNND